MVERGGDGKEYIAGGATVGAACGLDLGRKRDARAHGRLPVLRSLSGFRTCTDATDAR